MNEIRIKVTGVKKIIVEGCKTTNTSDFKIIAETKGEMSSKNGVI